MSPLILLTKVPSFDLSFTLNLQGSIDASLFFSITISACILETALSVFMMIAQSAESRKNQQEILFKYIYIYKNIPFLPTEKVPSLQK